MLHTAIVGTTQNVLAIKNTLYTFSTVDQYVVKNVVQNIRIRRRLPFSCCRNAHVYVHSKNLTTIIRMN